MPNYFVSCDRQGQRGEMESHLAKLTPSVLGVLDNVWFLSYGGDLNSVYQHVNSALSQSDRVLVIEAKTCEWHNLRVPSEFLRNSWAP
jgi:hypothetical protein